MNVETGLKLSYLLELVSIPVERSGGYLTDFRSSKNVARATVKYSAKTHIDRMNMFHLAAGNIEYPEVLDAIDATHVVVGKLRFLEIQQINRQYKSKKLKFIKI